MKKINYLLLLSIAVFSQLAFYGCKKDDPQENINWVLSWSDEFAGAAGQMPDATKWNYDTGGGGWGNNELETYTNNPANVSLDGNGHLVITAKSDLTSARIKTKGLFDLQYGKIEASIKAPAGTGMWPAFWMLGSDIDNNSWPACGEIDIMEANGVKPTIVHGTVHGPGYSGGSGITSSYTLKSGRIDTDYHLYAVEWSSTDIKFFVDGIQYSKVVPKDVSPSQWVFDKKFFLILNLAVSGNFVGNPPASSITLPKSMYIDYIKVYKNAN